MTNKRRKNVWVSWDVWDQGDRKKKTFFQRHNFHEWMIWSETAWKRRSSFTTQQLHASKCWLHYELTKFRKHPALLVQDGDIKKEQFEINGIIVVLSEFSSTVDKMCCISHEAVVRQVHATTDVHVFYNAQ